LKIWQKWIRIGALALCFFISAGTAALWTNLQNGGIIPASAAAERPIRWVDFDVPATAMEKALKLDIERHKSDRPISWIDLLAVLATRYGGSWKKYKATDLDKLMAQIDEGSSPDELMAENQYYDYYKEAYAAVLGEFLGEHTRQAPNKLAEGEKLIKSRYDLKVYSPIAEGFGYNHYDDFGNSRSYGYQRNHLGNDLIGSIGTPICAVEAGIVEHMGWNQYGGWRIGIRSLDGKRYYYYAHLRKDRPYHINMEEGHLVKAGEVIGYLGMTGYSAKANVSNISTPHLHFGMQLIFDPSQEEGTNEIWINVYEIVKLLSRNRSTVEKDPESSQYYRVYDVYDPMVEEYIEKNPLCRS